MTGLELLGIVMLVVMLFAIFIGLPISFTLLFLALIFGYFGLGVRVFNLTYLQTSSSLDGTAAYDDVADVDYRATLGPGLGAYLVKNEKRELSLEAGPSYLWEKVAGASDDYLALRFAERYVCQALKNAKLVQSLEYLPEAEDFDNYLLMGEIGIEAAMSEHLNLRVVLQDKYDNTPASGKERNDLSLIAGVGISM